MKIIFDLNDSDLEKIFGKGEKTEKQLANEAGMSVSEYRANKYYSDQAKRWNPDIFDTSVGIEVKMPMFYTNEDAQKFIQKVSAYDDQKGSEVFTILDYYELTELDRCTEYDKTYGWPTEYLGWYMRIREISGGRYVVYIPEAHKIIKKGN